MDFGRQQAQRDHLAASARSSALAVDLANQRYRSGMVDFLTVLDAERTQLAVEDQLAQSQTRTATALVAVYKALGGGWEARGADRLRRGYQPLISIVVVRGKAEPRAPALAGNWTERERDLRTNGDGFSTTATLLWKSQPRISRISRMGRSPPSSYPCNPYH